MHGENTGWEGGREPDEIRRFLREWRAPSAPPEIEEGLRRTFRRRRASRLRSKWLVIAASLSMAAGILALVRADFGRRDGPAGAASRAPHGACPRPSARSSPIPASPHAVAPEARVDRERRGAELARAAPQTRRPLPQTPAEVAIVVAPGQAELLRQLAGRLAAMREGARPPAPPQLERLAEVTAMAVPGPQALEPPRSEPPRYETRWETLTREWPLVQRPL